ncbi:MAG: porin family protein [Elusimicrobia bacterium]|nr:porin family protein [Elusimicrobiota bacterium]
MKRVLLSVVALSMLCGAAYAGGEVNAKFGIANLSYNSVTVADDTVKSHNIGFSLGAEYLYGFNDVFKAGAGVKYVYNDMSNDGFGFSTGQSLLPIYAAFQVNPLEADKNVFFKLNIGYQPLGSGGVNYVGLPVKVGDIGYNKKEGGLYWGLEAGYEFKSGVLFSASYDTYYSKCSGGVSGGSIGSTNIVNGALGVNLGYKFKM